MPTLSTADVLGRDLRAVYRVTDGRHEDLDLSTATAPVGAQGAVPVGAQGAVIVEDHGAAGAVDNAVQAVIHRIKTVQGELAALGHPGYGSRHHSLVGQPNTVRNRNLVKLYILQALTLEPRIRKVLRADIVADPQPDRVTISVTISFIGSAVPADLVIPFNFAGPR